MSDLIDRHAAIDALHQQFADGFKKDRWWNSTHVLAALEGLQTADAVPVIRCRDCKYNSNTEGNYVLCDIIPQMFGKTPDDNYCSWAERKGEE